MLEVQIWASHIEMEPAKASASSVSRRWTSVTWIGGVAGRTEERRLLVVVERAERSGMSWGHGQGLGGMQLDVMPSKVASACDGSGVE